MGLVLSESPLEETEDDILVYSPCGCQELNTFVHDSSLHLYLTNECPGWVGNPTKTYTLKYIIIVILACCKDKGILKKTRSGWIIECLSEQGICFMQALDPSFKDTFLYLIHLRGYVEDFHLRPHDRSKIGPMSMPPFICSIGVDQILSDILDSSWEQDTCLRSASKCAGSEEK